MDATKVKVPAPSSRKKFIYFSIAVIVNITITTTGILIYDTIWKQVRPTIECSRPGGQNMSPLTSNDTTGSATTTTSMAESAVQSTFSGVHGTSFSFETPNSTKPTQHETVSSHTSAPLTSGVKFSTTVQAYGSSVSIVIPVSASTELTPTETEVPSSRFFVPLRSNIILTTPLTSDVTITTPVQTYATSSTEGTTTNNTPTCQPSLPDTNAIHGYPIDCSEFNISVGFSGIHTIFPRGSINDTTLVNCASTSDGIWTIIQRRLDGSVNLFRNWTDYKEGFGDVCGEYWLGNDAIHQLTSRSSYKLKVVLKDWYNVTAYVVYNSFHISDESDGYRLSVGSYHGGAGDSLTQHSGEMFSTPDRDNDKGTSIACAVQYMGAWWFHNCYNSNLNGHYFHDGGSYTVGRILWGTFSSVKPLRESTMMIQKN